MPTIDDASRDSRRTRPSWTAAVFEAGAAAQLSCASSAFETSFETTARGVKSSVVAGCGGCRGCDSTHSSPWWILAAKVVPHNVVLLVVIVSSRQDQFLECICANSTKHFSRSSLSASTTATHANYYAATVQSSRSMKFATNRRLPPLGPMAMLIERSG